MKPRASWNLLKLVSTILEWKARAKFTRSCYCFTFALHLMKFDEVNLRFLRSLATTIVIRNSGNLLTSSLALELFEMKQTTICHEYGLKIKPSRGQVRHSVLPRTAFSRFFQAFLLASLFWKNFLEYYWEIIQIFAFYLQLERLKIFFFSKKPGYLKAG